MAVVTRLELRGSNGTDPFDKYPIAVNIPVSLNYNLADVRNPDQRKASFSKTINLNGTNEINKLFENIFSVNVATQYFNKNLKTPVRYLVNEIENFSGDLQLIKININPDNSIVYECSIIGAGGSLFVDIGEKYITGNPLITAKSGLLVINRYYTIVDYIAGDDFTNVATVYSGTINTDGCVFLATGTTPTTWTNQSVLTSNEDLEFREYNHNYTRANQIASRTTYLGTGTGYVYPFIDRGTNGGSDIVWNVKDFLPCFSIYEYITKIIAATGRTFTSTFLNSAEFKKLYCYSNVTTMNASLAQLQASQLYVGLNTNVNLIIRTNYSTPPTTNTIGTIYNFTAFNNESPLPFFDTGNQNSNGIITFAYTKNFNVVYHQKLKLKFNYFDPSSPSTVATTVKVVGDFNYYNYIQKSSTSNVWNNLNSINQNTIRFGATWTIVANASSTVFEATFTINTDYFDQFDIATGSILINANEKLRQVFLIEHINNYVDNNGAIIPEYTYYDAAGNELDPIGGIVSLQSVSGTLGSSSYALNSQTTLQEGDLLEVNNSLPTKIKQKDFFKSVVQAFNLYVDVDKDNENNLIIETFDEFYDADIVDYENRTDLAKEQSINPNLLEGKRYIYSYKSDADYYNTLYQNTWNETYGTEQIDVVNDFIKSDKKNELIFSGTPQAANYGLGIAMPRIYQLDGTNKKTIAANIRLLYCAVKTTANAYTYKQQGQTDLVTNEYLYAGMEDDPFNPTVSLMFGIPKEVYYNYVQAFFTTNNLYNRYHRNYLKNLIDKDAKFVTKYLWLNERDIYLFNFRNRLFIDGAYYIVNKIENYNPLELTSTKVELVKLLETDVFTPSSILISGDTAVNAGQDVQNYRLNSSLNVGTNIQNRGTNCLAVGNNIVIPASCTNLMVFGSNITADENSTGLLLNYKSYVALISQTGTSAPTAIVLENTLGDITFSYVGVGRYNVITSSLFTLNKTFALITNSNRGTNAIYQIDVDNFRIYCKDLTASGNPFLNDALDNTSIEIRVYN